jgi:hypothetical protein
MVCRFQHLVRPISRPWRRMFNLSSRIHQLSSRQLLFPLFFLVLQ